MTNGGGGKEDISRQANQGVPAFTLRPYAGSPEDKRAFAQVRNDTLRATSLPDDFEEWMGDQIANHYNQGGFDLDDNTWLVWRGDEVVAASVLYPRAIFPYEPPGNFHLYVAPKFWGHGLGSRLLNHVEKFAARRGYPVLETTIAREDAQSTRFLLNHGFDIVGNSIQLVRGNMDGLPTLDLPEGYAMRSLAELDERPEFYRETTNRLGAYDPNYSLVTPEEMERQLAGDRWDPSGVLFLSNPEGRIVGVIRADRLNRHRGYLNEIRIEPASRGRGLGTAMVAAALQYLSNNGADRAELDTGGENSAAHNLALRMGFAEVRRWLHFLKRIQ